MNLNISEVKQQGARHTHVTFSDGSSVTHETLSGKLWGRVRFWDWSGTYRVRTSGNYVGTQAGRSRRTGTKLHKVMVDTVLEWLDAGPHPVKPGQIWRTTTVCGYDISRVRERKPDDIITCKKCGN